MRCSSSSALQHGQAAVLLVLQDRRALVFAGRRDDRLGAGEERRHHHLVAEHEVVDDGVMAVELPSPRLLGGRLAHDRDVIAPFAQEIEVVAVSSASVSFRRMMSRVCLKPRALRRGAQQAERRARAALSFISWKLTPWRT